MAKMDWHEHERSTGLFSSETYWTYTVQRDDGSGYRTFTDRDEAQLYYNQLQALDNQEESLRLQRQEAADRAEQIRIQKQNQQPDWMRRMPPRPQPIPQQPAIRKCVKCGASLLDDSLFCHNCGARRNKCSCGGFLDAGMKFCPKCGKPTPEEEKRQAEERRRAEEAKIAEQKREAEERRRQEEAKRLYIDKGDYIELVHPIGNIRMIEKVFSPKAMNWNDAMQYAKNLRKGGFSDWRVPTKDELLEIYKIKDICGITTYGEWVWSSSVPSDNPNSRWYVYFISGYVYYNDVAYDFYVRCVR